MQVEDAGRSLPDESVQRDCLSERSASSALGGLYLGALGAAFVAGCPHVSDRAERDYRARLTLRSVIDERPNLKVASVRYRAAARQPDRLGPSWVGAPQAAGRRLWDVASASGMIHLWAFTS